MRGEDGLAAAAVNGRLESGHGRDAVDAGPGADVLVVDWSCDDHGGATSGVSNRNADGYAGDFNTWYGRTNRVSGGA